MSMPFYVAPEQLIKDKADYARKGIARGRSVIVLEYTDGVLFVAENPSRALHKISEIYDRIGFAAVGKYNEFENLRVAGVRLADMRGYAYDRRDVNGRSLANAYAQTLGTIFTDQPKPYEVEILLAEVGIDQASDQLFHIMYDGTLMDERGWSVLGGDAESITERLRNSWKPADDLATAVKKCVSALSGPDRVLNAGDLEVAVLQRGEDRRCFQRFDDAEVAKLQQ